MGQPGFFDLSRRYEGLDAKNDPLVAILAAVPFELFRPQLKAALVAGGLRTADAHRKSAAGRKPWDEVLIFKALVLQALFVGRSNGISAARPAVVHAVRWPRAGGCGSRRQDAVAVS